MTDLEMQQFRQEFKHIVYLKSEIIANTKHLTNLHAWDKNDSHKKAILEALEIRKALQKDYKQKMKGIPYDDWLLFSKNLSALTSKYRAAAAKKENIEIEINNLKFKL